MKFQYAPAGISISRFILHLIQLIRIYKEKLYSFINIFLNGRLHHSIKWSRWKILILKCPDFQLHRYTWYVFLRFASGLNALKMIPMAIGNLSFCQRHPNTPWLRHPHISFRFPGPFVLPPSQDHFGFCWASYSRNHAKFHADRYSLKCIQTRKGIYRLRMKDLTFS